MYGKLSLRALHTYIERDMYYHNYGVRFEKFGKKGPFFSVIIRGFALKKKKKLKKIQFHNTVILLFHPGLFCKKDTDVESHLTCGYHHRNNDL